MRIRSDIGLIIVIDEIMARRRPENRGRHQHQQYRNQPHRKTRECPDRGSYPCWCRSGFRRWSAHRIPLSYCSTARGRDPWNTFLWPDWHYVDNLGHAAIGNIGLPVPRLMTSSPQPHPMISTIFAQVNLSHQQTIRPVLETGPCAAPESCPFRTAEESARPRAAWKPREREEEQGTSDRGWMSRRLWMGEESGVTRAVRTVNGNKDARLGRIKSQLLKSAPE